MPAKTTHRATIVAILEKATIGLTSKQIAQEVGLAIGNTKRYLGLIEHVVVKSNTGQAYHCFPWHEATTREARVPRPVRPAQVAVKQSAPTRFWPKGRGWTPPPKIPTSVWDLAA